MESTSKKIAALLLAHGRRRDEDSGVLLDRTGVRCGEDGGVLLARLVVRCDKTAARLSWSTRAPRRARPWRATQERKREGRRATACVPHPLLGHDDAVELAAVAGRNGLLEHVLSRQHRRVSSAHPPCPHAAHALPQLVGASSPHKLAAPRAPPNLPAKSVPATASFMCCVP